MSLFITFEGGDGAGKSTQAQLLVKRLRKDNWQVIYAEEPGTTLLGRMLKEWLQDRDHSLTLIPKTGTQLSLLEEQINDHLLPDILLHGIAPRAELLAFTIARAQLVDEVIIPNLKNHNIVVCNRYSDSTTAYQGYGRGVNLELVEVANRIATQELKPNLTVLLDVAPSEGLSRKWHSTKDHFEKQVLDFHQKVRQGYLELAKAEPDRWLVVDAAQSRDKIAAIIWQKVSRLLSGKP